MSMAASLDPVAITDRQRYPIAEAWWTARRALELLDTDNLSDSTETGSCASHRGNAAITTPVRFRFRSEALTATDDELAAFDASINDREDDGIGAMGIAMKALAKSREREA